jgi:hypothetical protein
VTWLQRKDTDLHREDAVKKLQDNLADYALLIQLVRALNVPGHGDASNPGLSPQQNGALGKARVGGGGQMDNTGFGAPIVGPQVTLRVRSDEAVQTIQSGLSTQNPVEGYTALDRPAQQAGVNNR